MTLRQALSGELSERAVGVPGCLLALSKRYFSLKDPASGPDQLNILKEGGGFLCKSYVQHPPLGMNGYGACTSLGSSNEGSRDDACTTRKGFIFHPSFVSFHKYFVVFC